MRCRLAAAVLVVTCSLGIATRQQEACAATLVGDPFVSPFSGWVDPDPALGGSWRINLHLDAVNNPAATLMDTCDTNPSAIVSPPNNSGTHLPHLLVQDLVTTGANYEYTASMRTSDDDLFGIVFNYQDANNYFRAGIRQQPSSGTFGGTQGFSVQKIVNGVITQLRPATNVATTSPVTQTMIDDRTSFDLKVSVTGTSFNVFFNGVSQLVGGTALVDTDLVANRKIGFQSWAQNQDNSAGVAAGWGTEVNSITLTNGVSTVFSQSFNNTGPVKWRNLNMKNSAGISAPFIGTPLGATTTADRADIGNFGLDINDRWIMNHGNGFEYAPANNLDFIGPAVVVDDPGSTNFSNYEMKVRIAADDNDGMGVLVRVQDDNNFYRVNFATEAMDAGGLRAPKGLSVQKVRNGVWSELFRDDQNNIQFAPSVGGSSTIADWPGSPGLQDGSGSNMFFDLSVKCEGDTLTIQVTDYLGAVINYAPIVDSTDPLLTGTVGLTCWGNTGTFFMNYGGVDGAPLLTSIGAPAHAGDFDGDGDVDGADFVAWQTHFPTASGATLADGDADHDGDVDGADFVVWQTNFPFTPGPGSSPVPEPHAFLLVALAVPALVAARRRRS